MGPVESVVVPILLFLAIFLPSVLIAFVGWKITRKIQNEYVRIVVRSGVLSTALTPTIYGHAGPMFAVWLIFIGPRLDRFTYGLFPILVVWVISGGVAVSIRWLKRRKTKKPMRENTY